MRLFEPFLASMHSGSRDRKSAAKSADGISVRLVII
jgi:hypothetical protein